MSWKFINGGLDVAVLTVFQLKNIEEENFSSEWTRISQFEMLLGCAERETLKNLHVRTYQGGGGREED